MGMFMCIQPEELERYLSAFVLYSVKRLGERPTGDASEGPKQTGVTLCQILRTVRLKYVAALHLLSIVRLSYLLGSLIMVQECDVLLSCTN